jgi:hypothetical protein
MNAVSNHHGPIQIRIHQHSRTLGKTIGNENQIHEWQKNGKEKSFQEIEELKLNETTN